MKGATASFQNEEERLLSIRRAREQQIERLVSTKRECHRLLHEGQFEKASAVAGSILDLSLELYGQSHLELVSSYLLLGEASIGLSNYKQAEEYLSIARWVVVKNPETGDDLRSQLHRNTGMLYAAQGNHEAACKQLATDIYHSSCAFGPEAIETSGGYFQLGVVFLALQDDEKVSVMFDTVIDIWQNLLVDALNSPNSPAVRLDGAHIAEGLSMLKRIKDVRRALFGPSHVYFGESCYALALLYHYLNENEAAKEEGDRALEVYMNALGAENATTQDIRTLLTNIDAYAMARDGGGGGH